MTHPQRLYHHKGDVITNPDFFWVGSGGHTNLHPGNRRCRSVLECHALTYQGGTRSSRGTYAANLLSQDPTISKMKFVILRETALKGLEKSQTKGYSEEQPNHPPPKRHQPKRKRGSSANSNNVPSEDEASATESGGRSISKSRRTSLLTIHKSVAHIRSYPANTCIEVGFEWAKDILMKFLRGNKKNKEAVQVQDEGDEQQPRTKADEAGEDPCQIQPGHEPQMKKQRKLICAEQISPLVVPTPVPTVIHLEGNDVNNMQVNDDPLDIDSDMDSLEIGSHLDLIANHEINDDLIANHGIQEVSWVEFKDYLRDPFDVGEDVVCVGV